jgi:hypothetical protein
VFLCEFQFMLPEGTAEHRKHRRNHQAGLQKKLFQWATTS